MSFASAIQRLQFGPFELDLQSGELLRNGRRTRLQGQSFQILYVLLERQGQVVTREELQQILWPGDTFVDFESGLNNAVKRLRETLGDTADKPKYIETLPRRGYRFISSVKPVEAPVEALPAPEPVPQPPVEEQSIASRPSQRRYGAQALAGFLLVAVVSAAIWSSQQHIEAWTRKPIRSLAVLPLENLSADPSQQYFADGITEAVTTELAQVESLRVISRVSANRYRSHAFPIKQIARDLNVDAVVEGSVARDGNHVHVNAQLIEAADDRHLWASSFDRTLGEVLSLESELAKLIAREIKGKLTPNEEGRFTPGRAVDPVAYDLYLQGKYHERLFRRQDNDRAIDFFEKAVSRDPSFAQAQAALAFEYGTRANELNHSDEAWNRKAFAAVEKCLELNQELADCYQTRATLVWTLPNHFPYASGISDLKHALTLNPSSDEAEQQLANIYNHIGLFDKAKPHLEKASELNAANTAARFRTAVNLNYQGHYKEALTELYGSERFSPNFWGYHASYSLMHLGRLDEAEALLRKLEQGEKADAVSMLIAQDAVIAALRGNKQRAEERITEALRRGQGFEHFHHSAYSIASAYALMDRKDSAMQWLRRAAEEGFPCFPLFSTDPYLANLHDDPRYKSLMSDLRNEWQHNEETL